MVDPPTHVGSVGQQPGAPRVGDQRGARARVRHEGEHGADATRSETRADDAATTEADHRRAIGRRRAPKVSVPERVGQAHPHVAARVKAHEEATIRVRLRDQGIVNNVGAALAARFFAFHTPHVSALCAVLSSGGADLARPRPGVPRSDLFSIRHLIQAVTRVLLQLLLQACYTLLRPEYQGKRGKALGSRNYKSYLLLIRKNCSIVRQPVILLNNSAKNLLYIGKWMRSVTTSVKFPEIPTKNTRNKRVTRL
nr:MAG TPA: hypothetical protein [Caudoviricetes sp.]